MFEQLFSSMNKAGTPDFFGPMQQMMNSTMRLTQAQIKVMTELYDEVGQEFGNIMKSSSAPSVMAQGWPQLMATATRANAVAGALLMKNAQEFQSELIKMAPGTNPSLSASIITNMMEIAKTTAIANGGAAMQAARETRARKVA